MLGALTPPGVGHVNTVIGVVFEASDALAAFAGGCASLPIDFYVKTTGKGDLYESLVRRLLLLGFAAPMKCRALMLNCLSAQWANLWSCLWGDDFRAQEWARADIRLRRSRFSDLTPTWTPDVPLRSDYERRQALVEIDVLAARTLKLTLDELCSIYRIQFPVLQQNERDTWYDQRGRIVFTCSKGLPGVGLPRKTDKNTNTPGWEDVKDMQSGTVAQTITDDTLPGGPRQKTIIYQAPFDRCDREEDYATAWKFFDEAGL